MVLDFVVKQRQSMVLEFVIMNYRWRDRQSMVLDFVV